MAKVRTPREAWIEAGLQALAAGGPEAVRVEALASGLGVSKGGFYWHFKDRAALLEEMLDSWEQVGTDAVIERVEAAPAGPRERLRLLFEMAPAAATGFSVELAVRDWSRRDKAVAVRLARIDARRLRFVQDHFEELGASRSDAEARSMLAYSLLVGSYFIVAAQDGRSRSEVVQRAFDRLLEQPWG